MKEVKQIIQSYEAAKKAGVQCVLATVVHVEGSSYRQPGARMLIDAHGVLTGAISGGCLEGDALKKALDVIDKGVSKLLTYDTLNDEDPTLGVALGCNGIIKIVLEPIDVLNKTNAVELLKMATEKRLSSIMAIAYAPSELQPTYTGTLKLINANGYQYATSNNELNEAIKYHYENVRLEKRSKWIKITYNDQPLHLFFEYIEPPIKLVIVGAGNDVIPLLNMAEILGWESKVIDCSVKYIMDNRVPPSCALLIDSPDDLLSEVEIDDKTVFALMTHNYNYDKAVLYTLLQQEELNYVALLGPKKKLSKMLDDYEIEGKHITESQLAKIFGPAGLNIGAETPEEIALSILAEIKAVLSHKKGNSLKYIANRIHDFEEIN